MLEDKINVDKSHKIKQTTNKNKATENPYDAYAKHAYA